LREFDENALPAAMALVLRGDQSKSLNSVASVALFVFNPRYTHNKAPKKIMIVTCLRLGIPPVSESSPRPNSCQKSNLAGFQKNDHGANFFQAGLSRIQSIMT
jgi:hypothetical protein